MFDLSNWLLCTKIEKNRWGGKIKSSTVSLGGWRWPPDAEVELSDRRLDVCMWTQEEMRVGQWSIQVVIKAQVQVWSLRR